MAVSPRIPKRFRLTVSDIQMGVFMARSGQDALIRAVVTLAGRTEVERLRRALRLLLYAEPVAGCRLVEAGRRPYAARLPDLDTVELLTVFDVADDRARHQALERWSLTPFDPHDGPLVRAALFRSAEGNDSFCLKVHHLLCDGAGTISLLYELSEIYAHLERDPAYAPRPNVHGDRGYWQIARRLTPRELYAALKPQPMPWAQQHDGAWSLQPLPPGEGPGALVVRELPAGLLAAIRVYARAMGASVNDVLLAAWYRAVHRLAQPPPEARLIVMTHLNLRRRLPHGQAAGPANLSQMAPTSLGATLGDTLADTVERVHAEMARIKETPPMLGMILASAVLPATIRQRQMRRRMAQRANGPRQQLPPLFNNIGQVDPKRLGLGAAATNAYLTACLGREGDNGLQLVVTTCGEHVNLVLVMRENAAIWERVEALLAGFITELEGVTSQPRAAMGQRAAACWPSGAVSR